MERKPSNNDLNNLADSLATVSEVNIDILPSERMKCGSEKCGSEHIPENNKAKYLNVPGNSKITSSSRPIKEDGLQQRAKQAFKAEDVESEQSSVAIEEEGETSKLLQPASKDQKQTDLVMHLCLLEIDFEIDLTNGQLLKYRELLQIFCQSGMLLMQLLRCLSS